MDISAYSTYLSCYLHSSSDVEAQISSLLALEHWLLSRDSTLETASIGEIRAYLKRLIKQDKNGIDDLLSLLFYYEHSDRVDLNIYLSDVIHGGQEYEQILERVEQLAGFDVAWRIECECSQPPLGTDPSHFPEYTGRLLRKLFTVLSDEDVCRVICDIDESILPMVFERDLELYRAASSLDEYLLAKAKLELLRLQVFHRSNSKWKDVFFTEEYVRRVTQFPEMLSGVRRGNRIFVTLSPAHPAKYINAKTPEKKRYYTCHDPNINAGFLTGIPDVSIVWCERCVSRYRMKYECLLGRPLKAELVESALLGDTSCRIEILLEPDAAESSNDC